MYGCLAVPVNTEARVAEDAARGAAVAAGCDVAVVVAAFI